MLDRTSDPRKVMARVGIKYFTLVTKALVSHLELTFIAELARELLTC